MRYFKLFFFFLFLSFTGPVFAQIAKWVHPISGTFYQINFETKEIYEFQVGAQWNKIADLTFQDVKNYDLVSGTRYYQEIPIPGSSVSYLLVSCTGQVYQLDRENWVLKRLDQTFYRGANCQANKFLRNGVLYSFGGYGFWQSSNVLTKYDPINKEWTSIAVKGDVPAAINDGISAYIPSRDVFITMANLKVNDSKMYESAVFDWSIYEYGFKDHDFKKVGTIHLEELKKYLEKDLYRNFLFNGRYFILIEKSIQVYRYDTMIIIDLFDNFKTYRWLNSGRLPVSANNESFSEQEIHFKGKDSLAWLSNFSSKNLATKKAVQYTISLNDVLADSAYLGKLTDEPWYMEFFKVIMLSIGVLVIIFLIYLIGNIKRNRIKRNLKNVLGENEQKLLDFLLINYSQGYVNGHQLIAYFGRHKSSPESQRQFRSKLIDNFTKSLALIFQKSNILDIQQDEKDQRMLNYRLNSKIYKIISKL
jgi:hypothetical protein